MRILLFLSLVFTVLSLKQDIIKITTLNEVDDWGDT